MAGSHEVRGSIPLGSTTDPRGARRRRRAPLFLLPGTEKKARAYRTNSVSDFGRCGRPACSRPPSLEPAKRYEYLTGLCFLLGGFLGYVSCAVSYERIHSGVIAPISLPGKS